MGNAIDQEQVQCTIFWRIGVCQITNWRLGKENEIFFCVFFDRWNNVSFVLKVKPAGSFESPNLDTANVKLFSKSGHSALIQPKELEGRTQFTSSQQGSNLSIEGKAGADPSNDALVVEVIIFGLECSWN